MSPWPCAIADSRLEVKLNWLIINDKIKVSFIIDFHCNYYTIHHIVIKEATRYNIRLIMSFLDIIWKQLLKGSDEW